MAKVRVNVSALEKSVKEAFELVTDNKRMLNEIGDFASERMKFFARKGTSIVTGKKFEPLAESTKKQRARLQQFNKTGRLFAPKKSNLTLTGQLIESIKTLEADNGVVIVGPRGKRKPIRTAANRSQKKTPVSSRNEILAGVHQEGTAKIPDRPFLGLDDKGIARVKNIVLRFLRRSLSVRRRLLR